jgi:short-subunit dehydrogenase
MNENSVKSKVILIGNSDDIGLATTKRLLAAGWNIIGISRSESPITSENYHHRVVDVSETKYSDLMNELVMKEHFKLCIYFVGIGEIPKIDDETWGKLSFSIKDLFDVFNVFN